MRLRPVPVFGIALENDAVAAGNQHFLLGHFNFNDSLDRLSWALNNCGLLARYVIHAHLAWLDELLLLYGSATSKRISIQAYFA